MEKENSFQDLVQLMARLRSNEGCPWDREQTFASLRPYVLEEAYEVVDAIDSGNSDKVREECGDLLLQVVFLAQMAAESGSFDMADVITGIYDKLVHRHPHVFGETWVDGADQVVVNWERLKQEERGRETSALDDIPPALPALALAAKMGNRAARSGFDWRSAGAVLDKVREETDEIDAALPEGREMVAEEIGDLLFATAQLARFLKLDPELLLRAACRKFERRFREMEGKVESLAGQDDETMDGLWSEAKRSVG